eukprot:GILI01002214.1.p1 GENE.GILI01002214.1~~GILI01002214.1.p1  ORF type:complete len:534 (-),score=129.11 GILI01002214.1:21-1556(-)
MENAGYDGEGGYDGEEGYEDEYYMRNYDNANNPYASNPYPNSPNHRPYSSHERGAGAAGAGAGAGGRGHALRPHTSMGLYKSHQVKSPLGGEYEDGMGGELYQEDGEYDENGHPLSSSPSPYTQQPPYNNQNNINSTNLHPHSNSSSPTNKGRPLSQYGRPPRVSSARARSSSGHDADFSDDQASPSVSPQSPHAPISLQRAAVPPPSSSSFMSSAGVSGAGAAAGGVYGSRLPPASSSAASSPSPASFSISTSARPPVSGRPLSRFSQQRPDESYNEGEWGSSDGEFSSASASSPSQPHFDFHRQAPTPTGPSSSYGGVSGSPHLRSATPSNPITSHMLQEDLQPAASPPLHPSRPSSSSVKRPVLPSVLDSPQFHRDTSSSPRSRASSARMSRHSRSSSTADEATPSSVGSPNIGYGVLLNANSAEFNDYDDSPHYSSGAPGGYPQGVSRPQQGPPRPAAINAMIGRVELSVRSATNSPIPSPVRGSSAKRPFVANPSAFQMHKVPPYS